MTLWSTVIRGATSVENFFFIGFTIRRGPFERLLDHMRDRSIGRGCLSAQRTMNLWVKVDRGAFRILHAMRIAFCVLSVKVPVRLARTQQSVVREDHDRGFRRHGCCASRQIALFPPVFCREWRNFRDFIGRGAVVNQWLTHGVRFA